MTIFYSLIAEVTGISPNSQAGLVGGLYLSISGSYFFDDGGKIPVICRFGNILSFSAIVLDSNHIRCVNPTMDAPGSYLVSVSLGGSPFTTNEVYYTYLGGKFVQASSNIVDATTLTQDSLPPPEPKPPTPIEGRPLSCCIDSSSGMPS